MGPEDSKSDKLEKVLLSPELNRICDAMRKRQRRELLFRLKNGILEHQMGLLNHGTDETTAHQEELTLTTSRS